MFIVYSSNQEVIVCTPKTEKKMLKEWFEDAGRELEDYDRDECTEAAVNIFATLRVS